MLTNKDYCDYDTSIALSELGFPLKRMKVKNFIDGQFSDSIVTILLYEAQKWLRKEKRVEVNSCYDKDKDKWFYYVLFMDYPDLMGITVSESKYDSYEEALFEGITESVKILKDGNNS